jgi:CHAT domain-containing protein
MSSLVAKNLAHLAQLILDVESKRKICADLERRIEPLERAQLIVVSGELDRLNQLLMLLNQATEKLKTLEQADEETEALGVLDELEKILTDVQWELVENLNEALASKAQLQEQHVRNYDERLAEWPKFTRNLLDALEEANRTRAAVRREKSEITKLDAQVEQAKRLFQEAKYVEVEKLLSDISESQPVKDKDYQKRLREETELAKKFIRQADLLLLRSLEDAQRRYPYTVLLRTPSEPGSHGINIQGASRVARYDRDSWSKSLKDITEAVDRGLRSAWSAQNPNPAATQPPAVVGNAAAAPANNSEARNFTLSSERSRPANPSQDVNQLIKRVGKEMYRLLIPEPMQDYLIDNECSLIVTTNDLELPYELMSYDDKFLCLERPIARMPMGTAFPRSPRTARTEPKLRFLLIHSDPFGNLPAAKAEIEEVEKSLRHDWQEHIEIEVIKPDDATGPHLNDVLREGTFDVIHYAGHAYFDETDADLSGLLLFDDEYFRATKGERREQHFVAQKIRRLLEGRPLVFLNACQSTRTANEQQPQEVGNYLQGPAEGLAAAFIYGGALGCIGANWPIYDTAAAKFATTFYSNVIKGYMIGEAMRRARVKIKEQFPDNITWAAFVLYGDPTFRL